MKSALATDSSLAVRIEIGVGELGIGDGGGHVGVVDEAGELHVGRGGLALFAADGGLGERGGEGVGDGLDGLPVGVALGGELGELEGEVDLLGAGGEEVDLGG